MAFDASFENQSDSKNYVRLQNAEITELGLGHTIKSASATQIPSTSHSEGIW